MNNGVLKRGINRINTFVALPGCEARFQRA
jgi:hypothetical protein